MTDLPVTRPPSTRRGFRPAALLALGASCLLSSVALAAAPAKGATQPAKMTCEEFVALDEVSKPKLVYWAQGFNSKGQSESAVFETESTDRLVPVLVDGCTKEPKASFWKKMKAELKRAL